ncbi:MAG: PhoH family protein [Gammaproteobacteria bacterium]|nr:PhoH family protein [Gammaproteobacteria bacterium]
MNENLRHLERRLGVEINNRGNLFNIIGESSSVKATVELLKNLYRATKEEVLSAPRVHLYLQDSGVDALLSQQDQQKEQRTISTPRRAITVRGPNQEQYLKNVDQGDLTFGIGPAGTGKTYLAVACAVEALEEENVRRLILVRPAVEAGERLGFLPGDLSQKIDPYLRPIYDALYEMLGIERVNKLIERNIIEVAPLAYMRGRTLNDSFVILDEAQNTTTEQMKMFLTRIGFGSRTVVTGDITQVDLPANRMSGLRHVIKVLKDVGGVSFSFFTARDVVRHPLVQRIIQAYESIETSENNSRM